MSPTTLGYRHSARRCVGILLLAAACFAQQPDREESADQAFGKNDCTAATATYKELLAAAEESKNWPKAAFFYRRIGICAYRARNWEAAAAAYRSGLDAARRAGDLELELENTHGLSIAVVRLGQTDEALAYALQARELTKRCGHTAHVVRALFQLGLVYHALGQSQLAEQHLEEDLRIARQANDKDGVARATELLAVVLGDAGKFDEALQLTKDLIAQPDRVPGVGLAGLYINLGAFQRFLGDLKGAQQSLTTAERLVANSPEIRLQASIKNNLGVVRLSLGDFAAAEASMREALRLVQPSKNPADLSEVIAGISQALLGQGRLEEAAQSATEAVALSEQAQSPLRQIHARWVLGNVQRARNRLPEAIVLYEAAAESAESMRGAASGDVKSLQAIADSSRNVYQSLVDCLLRTGDATRALAWVERSKARLLRDIVARGGVQELSAMTAEERREESGLYSSLYKTTPGTRAAKEAASRLDAFRWRLYGSHPELALQRADFVPADLARWRSLLPDDRSVLLEFFVLPQSTALFVIRRNDVAVFQLPFDENGLDRKVREFRRRLSLRDITESETARELGQILFHEAMPKPLSNTTDWIISPDGPLWELPFEALIGPGGKRLLELHAITYTPSLTALLAMRGRAAAADRPAMNLFALAHPSLPDAEAEARAIARMFPAAKVRLATGPRATAEVFRQEAPGAEVVHVASHAEFNTESPLYSWLRLGPEGGAGESRLTAAELIRIPLRARVVVLSACETARGGLGEGKGLMGLGWAITSAGAGASVLSHWKVDSAATASLMTRFYAEFKTFRASPGAALRTAAIAVSRQKGYEHPFYWASFAVFGDGFR